MANPIISFLSAIRLGKRVQLQSTWVLPQTPCSPNGPHTKWLDHLIVFILIITINCLIVTDNYGDELLSMSNTHRAHPTDQLDRLRLYIDFSVNSLYIIHCSELPWQSTGDPLN